MQLGLGVLVTVTPREELLRGYIDLNLGGTLCDVDEVDLILALVHAVILIGPSVRVIII